MNQKIRELSNLIKDIKKRRGMFIMDKSYNSLSSFISGYIFAMKQLNGIDFSMKFKEWLSLKYETYFAVHWSGYILRELSAGNEEIAEEKLFFLFEEFIEEQESGVPPQEPDDQ